MMDNPFYKRATEYLQDNDEFLSIVTPEPVLRFLKGPSDSGDLYDRLVRIWGTPGSGKTTIARLFEFSVLSALARSRGLPNLKEISAAMVDCHALAERVPILLGCRIPLETSFRDFWELPYAESVRFRLFATFLQAKTALAWLRQLGDSGVAMDDVRIVPRAGQEARLESIGGEIGSSVQGRARAVEASVYRIVGSVVPPEEGSFPSEATQEFALFDLIEAVRTPNHHTPGGEATSTFKPLVILDDAHVLHPEQYKRLKHWIARRELRFARWMLARFDVLQADEAIEATTGDGEEGDGITPGLATGRDILEIRLQGQGPEERRTAPRKGFRTMAQDMANRYLARITIFSSRKMTSIADLLSQEDEMIASGRVEDLRKSVGETQEDLKITDERRESLANEIDHYSGSRGRLHEDVRLSMLKILMHRYSKRTRGPSLFPEQNPEPSQPVVPKPEVEDSARLHLLHEYDRPYYRGINDLCDASSDNAEQFLNLTGSLVDELMNQLSRPRPRRLLSATRQNQLLRQRAKQDVDNWNFPHHLRVRMVVETLGERCKATTLEPNGWLRPNAYGIPNEEFRTIATTHPELARILQFGSAYNVWSLRPNYGQGYTRWCLIELGGVVTLKYGLSLRRGGFLEGNVTELARMAYESYAALGPRR
jgi:hypothetical protein